MMTLRTKPNKRPKSQIKAPKPHTELRMSWLYWPKVTTVLLEPVPPSWQKWRECLLIIVFHARESTRAVSHTGFSVYTFMLDLACLWWRFNGRWLSKTVNLNVFLQYTEIGEKAFPWLSDWPPAAGDDSRIPGKSFSRSQHCFKQKQEKLRNSISWVW